MNIQLPDAVGVGWSIRKPFMEASMCIRFFLLPYYFLNFVLVKEGKMKINKSTAVSFILLVLIASLYRILPGRPMGFAPQIAMALFAGSAIGNKKLSFIVPLLSMFISDALYQVLFNNGLSAIAGFYPGQLTNYLLIALVTVIGFGVKKEKAGSILYGSLVGATFYFFLSNLLVWISGGLDIHDIAYPKSFAGLAYCYSEAIPFYKASIAATLAFSAILFGSYYLANRFFISRKMAAI